MFYFKKLYKLSFKTAIFCNIKFVSLGQFKCHKYMLSNKRLMKKPIVRVEKQKIQLVIYLFVFLIL